MIIEKQLLAWPYEINYDAETVLDTDVLIIGGGIAGCHAAIAAAKRGAKVTILDKSPTIHSGMGGAGVDHWLRCYSNPCSKVSPDEIAEINIRSTQPVSSSVTGLPPTMYITCRESYDALLDVEKMGVKVRDEDDEFAGAAFRDDETKLMFAYDYGGKHELRIAGGQIKPALYKELKRLGIQVVERVMTTGLLTEPAENGGKRICGAMGFHVRTGEFYIVRCKSAVLATCCSNRLWISDSATIGGSDSNNADPNNSGDGDAMAWRAGVAFTMMEASNPTSAGMRYINQTVGNSHNTWYGCSIVDSNGKEVPWVDRDGNVLKTVAERFLPVEGQTMFTAEGGHEKVGKTKEADGYSIQGPQLIPDLPERIRKGEYKLPFYADLPGMPEHERRAIWGLMIGNEGKTHIPVYQAYCNAGFDPDKDMLQANVLPSFSAGQQNPWWDGGHMAHPQWREIHYWGGGGPMINWDLETSVQGLFVAGKELPGGGTDHSGSTCTGRYAGRHAAAAAATRRALTPLNRAEVDREKERVYAPTKRKKGYGWKELRLAVNRVMREYCGEEKTAAVLTMGLYWLNELRNNEVQDLVVHNPHDLMRAMEWISRMDVAELILHSCLSRKRSCPALGFIRLDTPENTPENEQDLFTVVRKQDNGEVTSEYVPGDFWFQAPNKPTCKENYEIHALL